MISKLCDIELAIEFIPMFAMRNLWIQASWNILYFVFKMFESFADTQIHGTLTHKIIGGLLELLRQALHGPRVCLTIHNSQ